MMHHHTQFSYKRLSNSDYFNIHEGLFYIESWLNLQASVSPVGSTIWEQQNIYSASYKKTLLFLVLLQNTLLLVSTPFSQKLGNVRFSVSVLRAYKTLLRLNLQ